MQTQDHDIKVPSTPTASYTVRIGSNILASLLDELPDNLKNLHPFIVTDENVVASGHLAALLNGRQIAHYTIRPAGEVSKHIDTVNAIIREMEKAKLGRDTVVIGLGGGTVGDIAGFAAAIFKRGVAVVHAPTTTLAQADSSIGGKTGVDSHLSKNAYGAFHHPAAVFVDTETLKSLPNNHFRAGLVESIKHAVIRDAKYFEFLEANMDRILIQDSDALTTVALYNCKIKGDVVEQDPQERNLRRILNYGHTVGHAIETLSNFELLHGEAIGIGMIAAQMIEQRLGFAQPGRLERIREMLKKVQVPTAPPDGMEVEQIIEIMRRDKKAVNQWPPFVLVEKIGNVCCRDGQYAINVEEELVRDVLVELCSQKG